jgi:hypothetical protein
MSTGTGKYDQNGDEEAPIEVPEVTYQLPPEDIHEARCVWVIDIGTHLSNFNDEKKQRKVILGFELCNEKTVFNVDRGPEPFVVHGMYTMSLGERSNLYRDLMRWIGKRGIERVRPNLALLLGVPCLVNVQHKTTTKNQLRATIISISPLPKATRLPAQVVPFLKYSIKDGHGGAYNLLPEWVQKFLDKSEEFGAVRPSKEETAERNVREATTNALREAAVSARPHPPVEIDEPSLEELERAQREIDDLTR